MLIASAFKTGGIGVVLVAHVVRMIAKKTKAMRDNIILNIFEDTPININEAR